MKPSDHLWIRNGLCTGVMNRGEGWGAMKLRETCPASWHCPTTWLRRRAGGAHVRSEPILASQLPAAWSGFIGGEIRRLGARHSASQRKARKLLILW